MHVFTVIHNIKYFEHRRFRIITWWKKRREHLAKKIIAQRSPLFSPEQHSKTTAFTFLLVQLFFFFSQCEEKTSPFLQHSMKTGGNGGRRGVGGTQEWSCLSESIDRAKTRSEGEGEGGDWAGASTRTLSMMMLKTRDRGLNQSVKVILGGEQRGKRDRVVETESEGCWVYPRVLTLHLEDLVT